DKERRAAGRRLGQAARLLRRRRVPRARQVRHPLLAHPKVGAGRQGWVGEHGMIPAVGSQGYKPLARDVEAVSIPDGKPAPLAKGLPVKLTQALGASYTVQAEQGAKYRIAGRDGDAIGQPVVGVLPQGRATPRDAAAVEALARQQLKG